MKAPPFLFWAGSADIVPQGEAAKIGAKVPKQFGSEHTL